MSRPWFWAVCLASAGVLAWGGWQVVAARRFEAGLERVRALMAADRFGEARVWLAARPPRWERDPESLYRLGVCEHAGGDIQAALAAWSRVEARSEWGVKAGLARARTLVGDLGRFADAEPLLESLLRGRAGLDPLRDEVRRTLSELYFWEGRRDDVCRLIEDGWRNTTDPVGDLRDHWRAESSPTLVEKVRAEVERASGSSPDDDRVWLARASLAFQTGGYDETGAWLDRCAERRPDDPAVWRARLERGRACDDPTEVRRALTHLPTDRFNEQDRLRMRAWLAALRGDSASERMTLEQLATAAPGDTRALDRLASLASEVGDAARAGHYRRRKAEFDAAKDRYRLLMDDKLLPARFAELASLAETLGRRFEARGWWTLRSAFAKGDPDARKALARLREQDEPARPANYMTSLFAEVSSKSNDQAPRGVPSSGHAGLVVPRFRDDAARTGLTFVFDNGRSPMRQIPETTAGGVGLLDFDGDGWLDVFVVQGGTFPPDPTRPSTGDRLFRNRGDGTFEDASERSRIAALPGGFGHGVTVGDVDNDGRPDLLLTRWRGYALYRNKGDGTFEDITACAGLGGDRDWPTSAAFADLDNDGDLDLYVCHYLAWDEAHPTLCPRVTVASSSERSDPGQNYNYCTPRPFPARQDHLFRNDGGRFVDVTAQAGMVDRDGRGLGVVAADVDEDGLIDLFVANDTTANYLWHNLGGMKFEELGLSAGVACNADGAFQAGMGTACGDLDGDGRPDLLVTNFYGESTTCFRNLGGGTFGDRTGAVRLAAPSRYLLGFGIVLFDANNDGRLDVATANGHVNDDRPDYPYDMPALLLAGGEDGRLVDMTAATGAPWTVPRVARGLAAGDLDNDGRVDALLLSQKSPLAFFHNVTENRYGHFVTIQLEGTKSNRDGIGAAVTVTAGGRDRRAWRVGGGSYQSASDPRLHFGLGGETRIEGVEVRWPSGRVDHFASLEADRGYRLIEGDPQPRPLPGAWRGQTGSP
jgi:tetratricopeptide (TPR) repeat protein